MIWFIIIVTERQAVRQTACVCVSGAGERGEGGERAELRGANPREPPEASLIKLQQSVRQTGRHGDRLIEAESLGVMRGQVDGVERLLIRINMLRVLFFYFE